MPDQVTPVPDYTDALTTARQQLCDGLAEMDCNVTQGKGCELMIRKESKRFFIDGVMYRRPQAQRALQRIDRCLDGLRRCRDMLNSGEWEEGHLKALEVVAELDLRRHIKLDSGFYIDRLERSVDRLEKNPSGGGDERDEYFNSLAAYLKGTLTPRRNDPALRKQWMACRLYEIASVAEFNSSAHPGIVSNIDDYDSILPYDAIVMGDATLEDLQSYGRHLNGFSQLRSELLKMLE